MLFSSAEVKEHTKLYVTATPVTQKREKVPSYLLFARLSARSSPLIFFFEYKKHRIERCFFVLWWSKSKPKIKTGKKKRGRDNTASFVVL